MIDWIDPREVAPEDGEYIVALSWHCKAVFPSSMEIIGGVVESYYQGHDAKRVWRVQTEDYSGNGSYSEDGEDIDAWCSAGDFIQAFPNFLKIQTKL